ncbi:DoxX family protein [Lichenibacterium dinghuense]|uniref:DoxX family protein n=1 Tax=Lichenibacterium dinghuense TaxID=2895977 RepID=UPI001F15E899|nr:DoxX family protein [Lichenibacterium sp. 6Y81]
MSNLLHDLVAFLTGETADYTALGAARYVVILAFYALVVCSVLLLAINLRQERAQRSGALLWLWIVRVLVGCMWFQALLGTLPFGTGNSLYAWTQQAGGRAAFPRVGQFINDTLLTHFTVFDPVVFLVEFVLAAALILGLFVRLAGLCTFLAGALLFLGVYGQRPGDPAVWPWGFVFLALLGGSLAVSGAGRALGADAWIRRNVASVRDRRAAGWPLRLLT